MTPVQQSIVIQLYQTLEILGADRFLLGIVGSWGDTMTDDEVLSSLKRWNETGEGFEEIIASTSTQASNRSR